MPIRRCGGIPGIFSGESSSELCERMYAPLAITKEQCSLLATGFSRTSAMLPSGFTGDNNALPIRAGVILRITIHFEEGIFTCITRAFTSIRYPHIIIAA